MTQKQLGLDPANTVDTATKAYVDAALVNGHHLATIGDGAETSFEITHNLGFDDVLVQLREVSSGDIVRTDITIDDENTITLTFQDPPDTNSLRVLVVAPGITSISSAAVTAITDYLTEQSITFTDEGEGTGHFNVGGVPVSGTLTPPAATVSGVAGMPFLTAVDLVADGETDNTTFLTDQLEDIAEITAVLTDSVTAGKYDTQGGGRIIIPPGVYAISGPLVVQPRTTVEAYGVTLIATDASACITIPQNPIDGLFTGTGGVVKGLTFDGADTATNGFVLEATRLAGLEDCTVVRTTGDGYVLKGSQWSVLTRCQARQCGGWGLTLLPQSPDGAPYANNNLFLRFYSQTNTSGGVRLLNGCQANTFVGLTSQYTTYGVYLAGGGVDGNAFVNPHLEACTVCVFVNASDETYTGSPSDNVLEGPFFFSQYSADPAKTERYVINEGFRTRIANPVTDTQGPQKARNGVCAAYEQNSSAGAMSITNAYRMAGAGAFASDGALMYVDETGSTIDPSTAKRANASRLFVHDLTDPRQQAETRFAKLTLAGATTSDERLALRAEADGDDRLIVRADGRIIWGDGAGTEDIYLYRIAAGQFGVQGGVRPSTVNSYDLGVAGAPWKRVFFGTATVAPNLSSGSGSPEGVVSANVGSLYTNTDGGESTTLYVKEGGGAGSTGWVAK